MQKLIIFDFDGVIADSEALSNAVLAEAVTDLGVPTTLEDSYRLYMGTRSSDIIARVEAHTGLTVPPDFADRHLARTLDRFTQDLRPVPGAVDYIDAFAHVPQCIASSSSPERLAHCLDVLDLTDTFGPRVYSAANVPRGKPHPDIFLHAADQMGVAPENALVIEDSVSGVTAAVRAGMTAVGLVAASHIQDGTAERLREAGAVEVAGSFADATRITRDRLK